MVTNPVARKIENNLQCSTFRLVSNKASLVNTNSHLVLVLGYLPISLGQLVEEKGPSISQFMGNEILKGTEAFNSIPHFAFKDVLLISKSH